MALVLAALILGSAGSAAALRGEGDAPYSTEGGNLYFNPATGEITDMDPSVSSALIPGSINGIPVTGIADQAFWMYANLRSVSLSEGAGRIGESGCRYCKSRRIPAPDRR